MQLAGQVEAQITALRKIAGDEADIGKTADKIRSAAAGLAGSLQAVATRYQVVSSALAVWSEDLGAAQALSVRALNDAEAPYARLAQIALAAGSLPPALGLQPAGRVLVLRQAQAQAQAAMAGPQADLEAAGKRLSKAVSDRDTRGAYAAAKISAATADSLADSGWEEFTTWVTGNAGWLNGLANALGDIVGILGIVVLLIPGVDLIVFAAIALTAVALVIHAMLAATGNSGWLNVGLDIFALVTMGYGAYAAKSVEAGAAAARELAAAQRKVMLTQALESGPFPIALRLFRSQVNADGSLSGIGRLGVKNVYKVIGKEVPKLPEAEKELAGWAKTAQQLKAGSTTYDLFRYGGDPAIATAMKDISEMRESYSSVDGIAQSADRTVKIANISFASGTTAGFSDSIASQMFAGSNSWKEDISTYVLSAEQVDVIIGMANQVALQQISSPW